MIHISNNKIDNFSNYTPKFIQILKVGMASNYSTFAGVVIVYIFLEKFSSLDNLVQKVFTALAFVPMFMADAINSYFLNRIKLDYQNNWNDIYITDKGKQVLHKWHYVIRFISFFCITAFALYLLLRFFTTFSHYSFLLYIFLILFLLVLFTSAYIIKRFIQPLTNLFCTKNLILRLSVSIIFASIIIFYLQNKTNELVKFDIFVIGLVLFFIWAWLHPLPTKYLISSNRNIFDLKIYSISFTDLNAAEIACLKEFSRIWKEKLCFESLGYFKIPLLQMPVIQVVSEVLVSDDKKYMLQIIISQLSGQTVDYNLLSYTNNFNVVVTTSFKYKLSSTINFVKSQNIVLDNLSEDSIRNFYNSHKEFAGTEIQSLDFENQTPIQWLETVYIAIWTKLNPITKQSQLSCYNNNSCNYYNFATEERNNEEKE